MRQTARSYPPVREESALDLDPPLESLTRLKAAPRDATAEAVSVANTRPTTPVPSFYFLLGQPHDDGSALAGRLEDLGDDTNEALDRELSEIEANEENALDPITATRPILAARVPVTIPVPSFEAHTDAGGPGAAAANSLFALLSSISRVPYLCTPPRAIPRAEIQHAEACVLALIDGRTSIEQVLDASSLPIPRVLRILNDLLERRIIGLKP